MTSGRGGPGHPPAKKVFSPAVSRLAGEKRVGVQRSCQLYGVNRQGSYQRGQRQVRQAERDESVLVQVRAVRTKLPRVGTHKLHDKIAPLLRAQGAACGRDALFTLLRQPTVYTQVLAARKAIFQKLLQPLERPFSY